MSEDVVAALGSIQISTISVRTSMEPARLRPQYFASLSIEMEDLDGARYPVEHATPVLSQPLDAAAATHQGILGMDVLRRFHLVYDGPGRTFQLLCDRPT